jgi:hypothetical protein
MNLKVRCDVCKAVFELQVDASRYQRWKSGEGYVQTMFPELTSDQRELLLSQTCGKCFDSLFKEED